MTWFTFTVTPDIYGDIVAGHLLHMANDAATLGRVKAGAAVFRRKLGNGEQFFVTPSAVELFEPFIRMYGGQPCDAPQTRDLLSLDLPRLRVEERVDWEVMASRERPGETLREEPAQDPSTLGA